MKLARDARQISGKEVFIAGSIGPLGEHEEAWPEDRGPLFAEQACCSRAAASTCSRSRRSSTSTSSSPRSTAVRSVSSLPIVAMMTFGEDAETIGGVCAAEAAARLRRDWSRRRSGRTTAPGRTLRCRRSRRWATAGCRSPRCRTSASPACPGGRIIYPHAAPEYFAEFAAHARELGAKVIGGCCGTTPTEIAAIRRAVDEGRAPPAPLEVVERELAAAVERDDHETRLAADLREGRFVTSIQIDPPLGANYEGLLEVAAAVRDSGLADYVDVNDNATARVGMNPLIVSAAIERQCGIETIPHLTPRDTTVMGLESVLLGAHAEGIRNVLAVTGDPPEVGDYPGSGGVYEVDSIGLTHLISQLNRGENYNGKAIDAPTSFFIGVAVNPNADDPELELDRFRRKVDEGASFAMTQIVFDLDDLDRFMAGSAARRPCRCSPASSR